MPVAECVRGPWVLGVSPHQARSPRGVVGEGRQLPLDWMEPLAIKAKRRGLKYKIETNPIAVFRYQRV